MFLDFKDDSGKRLAKKFKIIAISAAISGSLTWGYTLAANISLNDVKAFEFGQGVLITTACSGAQSLIVTPNSQYDNADTSFMLSSITVGHIPQSCKGMEFKISIYSTGQILDLDTGVNVARVAYKGLNTQDIYKGVSGIENFGAEITNVEVADNYGTFTIRLTGNPSTASDLNKITIESSCTADGTDLTRAGESAYQIHQCNPGLPNGVYWIQNDNLNAGYPFQIYADMKRNGGGWTLILANSNSNDWTDENALNFNSSTPPSNPLNLNSINGHYSIVNWADDIKHIETGFQYRIDATTPGNWGGVWTANQNYSFTSQSNGNTQITLNTKFGNWDYSDNGIEERMPYFAPANCGLLTTSNSPSDQWWGTLVSKCGWSPVPWISGGNQNPEIIWYWVR